MRRRDLVATSVAAAASLQPAFLLTLLVAARAAARRPQVRRAPGGTRFVVLVPAHDESDGLLPTLTSLSAQDYPAELVRVVVVADNCTDDTAEVARAAGAEVLERHDLTRRGKGEALAWALPRVLDTAAPPDAVVFVDADCTASPGLLAAFDERVAAGDRAVQCRYDASNPAASANAALRYAAMVLFNTVRLEGKQALGASSGLSGTGMCLTTGLLREVPWGAASLSEDIEQHARLVRAGVLVGFVPSESVASPMPVTRSEARDQELRWEAGRLEVAREHGLPLLAQGLLRRDRSRALNGVDLLTLPHSAWVCALVATGLLAAASRSRSAGALVVAAAAAEGAYVLGGLQHAGAPPAVRSALLQAPGLVLRRLPLLARVASGQGPVEWVRTTRSSGR